MPKPDWNAFKKLKHVTAENFRPYAEAKAAAFTFAIGAKIDKGVFAQLQGWGRNKTTSVSLEGIKLTRAHFEELRKAPLDGLYLDECEFKDADAAAIKGSKTLTSFFADIPTIGDKTCSALAACKSLQHISLCESRVTDKGVALLAKLSTLDTLYLHGTAVSDKGIAAFASTPTLKVLGVSFTENITDAGILKLAGVPKLEIAQTDCAITDEGIDAFLKSQRELKRTGKTLGKSTSVKNKSTKKAAKKKSTTSKSTAPDASEVRAAQAVLFSFFEAINQWEYNSELSGGLKFKERVSKALEKKAEKRTERQLKSDIQAIFKKHCTPKKRSYGRANGGSHSIPPTYDQYKKVDFYKVEVPTTRKLIFYTREWQMTRYQFVMAKKGDAWLVDHKKALLGKWENDYL